MSSVITLTPAEQSQRRAQPVFDWLLGDGRLLLRRTTLFFAGFCDKLTEIGVPLDRSSLHVRQLHPRFAARTLLWNAEAGGAVQTDRRHGINNSDMYLLSPVRPIYEGDAAIRRRLADPACAMDFPVLDDLRGQGYSDYTIRPLAYSTEKPMAISFASRRPEGFNDCDLRVVDMLLPAFAGALEVSETRRTARLLLDTYVGRNAGGQVLAGDIQRGQGQTMTAVLWFSDLRNFSGLSNERPLDEVIGLLNRYFDLMAEPIERHGGEILKFIGDAVLAIFPIADLEGDCCRATEQALLAAEEALQALSDFNADDGTALGVDLRTGIALHIGEVMYGNVGAADRLDFTVVGPAVNLASRLEGLTRDLDPPLVVSAALAEKVRRPLRSLGAFELKGFAEPQQAFALDP